MKNLPSSLMTKTVAFLAVFGLALAAWNQALAQTPFPIYEPFPASYTNGSSDESVQVPAGGATTYPARRLGNGATATLWALGNSPGGGSTVVVGGTALSYAGLYQDPNPNIGLF